MSVRSTIAMRDLVTREAMIFTIDVSDTIVILVDEEPPPSHKGLVILMIPAIPTR